MKARAVIAAVALAGGMLAGGAAVHAQEDQIVPGATSTPPPPGPPRIVQYPTPVATTLPNGLRVVAVRVPGSALDAADLVVPGGAAGDPDAASGVASLTASLLTRGTSHRTAKEIAVAEDALGATLTAGVLPDRTDVFGDAVAARFPAALAILADAVRDPIFASDELTLAKQRAVNGITLQNGQAQSVATQVAQRALFSGPFGRPSSGTARSIAAIDRAQVLAYYRTFYRPDTAVLVIGGDLAAADAFALAQTAFGSWSAPPVPLPPVPAPAVRAPARIIVVDQAGTGRTAIVVAQSAPLRTAPDWAAASVANAILSGYSGRLNEEIRVKRGLSYGAGSSYVTGRYVGAIVASTLVDHTKVPEALDVMLAAFSSLPRTPLSAAELNTRRTSLLGEVARGVETTGGIVRTVAANAFNGLPPDALSASSASLGAIDAPAVTRLASGALAAAPTIVLVGDAAQFIDAVRKAHPEVQVVKAADLDLTSATLTR